MKFQWPEHCAPGIGDSGVGCPNHSWCSFILSTLLVLVASSGTAIAKPVYDSAFQLLNDRVVADKNQFYIYEDEDSGFNHGFPSGFIGDTTKIVVNMACINDSTSTTGCTNDSSQLDQRHGTVAQITFQPLPAGDWAGFDFEEPQHYVSGATGNGYNVLPATRILFRVRSPTGIAVQFGAGGATTSFVTLPASKNFVQACIAVQGVAANVCPKMATIKLDLLNSITLNPVHILFTVVTNDSEAPAGGVVLLDNIEYDPVPTVQQAALSLPLSTQTFGVVPVQTPDPNRYWPIPPDQVNRNIAALYEASLTEMALLARGTQTDLASAKAIADALVYATGHDNRGDPLPIAPDGATGLHNGYESGDLTLLNSQGTSGGQAGQVRLSGFTASNAGCGASSYCLVLDGATGGNNAFAVMALLRAFNNLGDSTYLNAAVNIGDWIYELLLDASGTGFGGYFVGYPDGGALITCTQPDHCLIKGKSTENNADIFAAFSALANTEAALGNTAAAQMWSSRAKIAGDFVITMFDASRGCFNAGTVPAGTPASWGIAPSGPQQGTDITNVFDYLDATSFSYLALAPTSEYGKSINWEQVVGCLSRFSSTASVSDQQQTYSGYSLIAPAASVAPLGVAWEFTGQAGVVIAVSGGNPSAVSNQMHKAKRTAPFGDGLGLPASTLNDGDVLMPIDQCLSTPFQCVPERVGIASSAWWIFAETGYNLFQ